MTDNSITMATDLPRHWCIVCRGPKSDLILDSNLRYNNYEGRYCESCAEDIWDCPECPRKFYIGKMPANTKPRHYRNIVPEELDFRLRVVREECPGWKSDKRLAAERYYGFSTRVPSAKHQPRAV